MGRRKALNEILPRFTQLPHPLRCHRPPAPFLPPPKRSPLSPVPGGDLRPIQSGVRRCGCARACVCVLCHSSRGRRHVSPALGRHGGKEICIGFIYYVFDEYRLSRYGGLFVSRSQAQNLTVSLAATANVFSFFLRLFLRLSQGRGQEHI